MTVSADVSMATGSEVNTFKRRRTWQKVTFLVTGLITCALGSLETSNWSPVCGLCRVMDWEPAPGQTALTRFLPVLISGSAPSRPRSWSPAERVEIRLHYLKV